MSSSLLAHSPLILPSAPTHPFCLLFLHHQYLQETKRTWAISSHHDDTQGSPSSNLFLPTNRYILKVLQPLKSIPPARDQVFKHKSSPETSHSNHIQEEKPTCQPMLKGKKSQIRMFMLLIYFHIKYTE